MGGYLCRKIFGVVWVKTNGVPNTQTKWDALWQPARLARLFVWFGLEMGGKISDNLFWRFFPNFCVSKTYFWLIGTLISLLFFFGGKSTFKNWTPWHFFHFRTRQCIYEPEFCMCCNFYCFSGPAIFFSKKWAFLKKNTSANQINLVDMVWKTYRKEISLKKIFWIWFRKKIICPFKKYFFVFFERGYFFFKGRIRKNIFKNMHFLGGFKGKVFEKTQTKINPASQWGEGSRYIPPLS